MAANAAPSYGTCARVYSYQRFSGAKQEKGDSFERQNETAFEVAKQLAADRKMPFDESISAGDKALSARYGDHIAKGVLGEFLAAIELGLVPYGSILVVEDIDRLSRAEPVDAIDLIVRQLIGKGVSIYANGVLYDKSAVNSHTIFMLIALIINSYQSSQQKSERIGAAWKRKLDRARMEGKKLTKMSRNWLGFKTPDGREITDRQSDAWRTEKFGEFFVIPEAAEAINRIFDLKLQGFAPDAIAKKLNGEKAWFLPYDKRRKTQGYNGDHIRKLLKNRALIGEHQPRLRANRVNEARGDVLTGYYPVVVPLEKFNDVQKLIADNKQQTGGSNKRVNNLFRSLLICPYCAGKLYPTASGTGRPVTLMCAHAKYKSVCDAPKIRCDLVENLILKSIPCLRLEQVVNSSSDKAVAVANKRQAIQSRKTEIAERETKIANLRLTYEDTKDKDERGYIFTRIELLKTEIAGLTQQNSLDVGELNALDSIDASFASFQDVIRELKEHQSDVDFRIRLRTHLAKYIARVDVFTRGKASSERAYGEAVTVPDCAANWRTGGSKRFASSTREDGETLADDIGQRLSGLRRRWQKGSDGFREPAGGFWLDGVIGSDRALFQEFLHDLHSRRMSKEGAFVRVWFTTGAMIDLVPAKSIADGHRVRVPNADYKSEMVEYRKAELKYQREAKLLGRKKGLVLNAPVPPSEYLDTPISPGVEDLWAEFMRRRTRKAAKGVFLAVGG